MSTKKLGETSSIAHNAMFILALVAHKHLMPDTMALAEALARGILHQQRPDGSFHIYFSNNEN